MSSMSKYPPTVETKDYDIVHEYGNITAYYKLEIAYEAIQFEYSFMRFI